MKSPQLTNGAGNLTRNPPTHHPNPRNNTLSIAWHTIQSSTGGLHDRSARKANKRLFGLFPWNSSILAKKGIPKEIAGMQWDCCCILLKSGNCCYQFWGSTKSVESVLTTQMVRDCSQSQFSSFPDWYKLLCCMLLPIQGTLSPLKWGKTGHFYFERLFGIKRQFRRTSHLQNLEIQRSWADLILNHSSARSTNSKPKTQIHSCSHLLITNLVIKG